jgi:hypothetical protein
MSEARFSFTTKVNNDLLTVRGDSGGEFATNITYLLDNAEQLVEAITRLQALGAAAVLIAADHAPAPVQVFPSEPAPVVGGWGTPTVPAQAAPVAQSAPPAFAQATVPQCVHGARTPVAKANWRAWFCPTPKDTPGKCEPIFLDAKKDPAGWNAFPV